MFMKISHSAQRSLAVSALGLLCFACATISPEDPHAQTKRGAMIGAAVGAAAGLFVGDGELDEVLGTAAVGAGVGAGVGVYMDKQQRELEAIENVDVARIDQETLAVGFDSDILFSLDSHQLNANATADLNDFAAVMNDYPSSAILIQGHTDSSGSADHNQRLSERRADVVRFRLAEQSVDPQRMLAIGYGETHPVADNETPQGRAQNRRVTILVRGNG